MQDLKTEFTIKETSAYAQSETVSSMGHERKQKEEKSKTDEIRRMHG